MHMAMVETFPDGDLFPPGQIKKGGMYAALFYPLYAWMAGLLVIRAEVEHPADIRRVRVQFLSDRLVGQAFCKGVLSLRMALRMPRFACR